MIVGLCILILFSAFLSGSETALFSLSPLTLKSYQSGRSKRLQIISLLMQNPRQVLVTILILNVFANILIQNTVSAIFDNFSSWVLKILLPLGLTLLFGELLPKSFAMPNHIRISYLVSPVIRFFALLLRPIREPLTKATGLISRALFFFLKEEGAVSSEELKHILKTSEEKGILSEAETDLIEGTLELQHSSVKKHMRPREEILFYDIHRPIRELIALFTEKRLTRIPVCNEEVENVLGIVHLKDFFFQKQEIKRGEDIKSILKKPFFLPETSLGWQALGEMRKKGIALAIVVDEYGSVCGLLTQEDLIEAVVGEISDPRDKNSLYSKPSEDVVICSGKWELKEFQEVFGQTLETKGDAVTIGGWLIEQLEDIPLTGTKYASDEFLFYILAAEPNRIAKVYIRRLKK